MTRVLLIGLLASLPGCDLAEDYAERREPKQEIQLAAHLPADAVLVGVARMPNGKLYVLDQRSGLYEVEPDGSRVSFVYNTTGLSGVELTDVVALDNERLALTAENDGFLFNLGTRELTSYFCYLPAVPAMPPEGAAGSSSTGGSPSTELPISVSQTLQLQGVGVRQRTESVAFNPVTRQLFAQPRTFRLDTGDVAGSELFTFDESGGEPIRVQPFVNPNFVAGGMLAPGDNRLLAGAGRQLYEVLPSGDLKHLKELDASVEVSGMAPGREALAGGPSGNPPGRAASFWVLDGAGRRLLELLNL